ncbi:MAG: D-glycero-beta-D-manno-heptose-7-phosphate kinase [Bdellovibrionaceae bacterium]|nr:D-glycero-beta-D-manno-heptose-7-phosphate kinase [Pseudobdellovibrionaceae bacterium]
MSTFSVRRVQIGPEQKKRILDQIDSLQGLNVLIVGDVGLDEYVLGDVRRISPEAPVPVLEVTSEDKRLGLAANVAQNVVSLGGKALMVGVVGQDEGARMLRELCESACVSWDHMVVDPHRPTTRKTRVMAQPHHIVRVDYELRRYLSAETEARVLAQAEAALPNAQIVILQDYAKGVVSRTLVEKLVALCDRAGKLLLVDPHRDNSASFYRGAHFLKPNYDESVALSGLKFEELRDNPNKVYEVGRALQIKSGAEKVVITRGKEGMTIFDGESITDVPTYARKVFDVTGAGDTVIASIALGLARGMALEDACLLANFAAGVVVGKVGCVPCEVGELKEYIAAVH